MSKKIRLGLVPYLNVKPVSYPLLTGAVKHNFSFSFAPPSQLAHDLKEKKLDVALIPSIEYAASEDYVILPDLAIAANGAVRSVFLYAKKPFPEVKTVALDSASRTSAALVKILFAERFGLHPEYIQAAPPLDGMLEKADAALIIGDNALQIPPNGYYRLDLGEEWTRLTGHPFVFAFFAAHNCVQLDDVCQTLLCAKKLGSDMIARIAFHEARNLDLNYFTCLDYLSQRIRYDLDPQTLAGLESFYKLAKANNIIGKDVRLKFYRQKSMTPIAVSAPRLKMVNA